MVGVAEHRLEGLEGEHQVGPPALGLGERGDRVGASLGQVGAVGREAREQLGQGVGDGGVVEVDLTSQPAELGCEGLVGDSALAVVHQVGPAHRLAAQPGLQGRQRLLAVGVGEHAVDLPQHVVPGRAGGGPPGREHLSGLQDLLDHDVGAVRELAQVLEVGRRVAQAVGVVDAQPVDEVVGEPPRDLRVRLREHPRVLDPEAGQGGDGEEAAVVQLPVAPAPRDQLVVLPGVHRVGVARGAVRGAVGQGEAEVVVAERAVDHRQVGDPAVGEQVVVADDRQQDAPAVGLPVDVERLGVRRGAAVLQEVAPPGILGRGRDTHVVGHDVDQHAHPEPASLGRQRLQPLATTSRRVDERGVDDVVAVLGAGLGPEQRREVDPVDAEVVQVGEAGRRVVQVERLGDLEAVGAGRDPHVAQVPRRAGIMGVAGCRCCG